MPDTVMAAFNGTDLGFALPGILLRAVRLAAGSLAGCRSWLSSLRSLQHATHSHGSTKPEFLQSDSSLCKPGMPCSQVFDFVI